MQELLRLEEQGWQALSSTRDAAQNFYYKVTAQREGSSPYVALTSSTYVCREDQWKLVVHQQTPV